MIGQFARLPDSTNEDSLVARHLARHQRIVSLLPGGSPYFKIRWWLSLVSLLQDSQVAPQPCTEAYTTQGAIQHGSAPNSFQVTLRLRLGQTSTTRPETGPAKQ